jgi:hypothetical protein
MLVFLFFDTLFSSLLLLAPYRERQVHSMEQGIASPAEWWYRKFFLISFGIFLSSCGDFSVPETRKLRLKHLHTKQHHLQMPQRMALVLKVGSVLLAMGTFSAS